MSGRYVEMQARIETAHKLEEVIAAMRGIAASRVQEAHLHLDSIRTFAATIGAAIGEVLAFLPQADPAPATPDNPTRQALLVFAAEQGFAGSFSEKIFEAADPLWGEGADLFVLGDRGMALAEERGHEIAWSAPMISHPAQVASLATRLTEAIFSRMAEAPYARVTLVHASPGGAEGMAIEAKRLIPFDYSRFPPVQTKIPPRLTLPPEDLLQDLIEEHVFAELAEAVMLSFAAENEARMRAMIAAQDNTADTLSALIQSARSLRQEEITEEIVELATASLPVR